MRYLYSVLFYLALPFIFLRLLWLSRHAPEYKKGWAERLGFYSYHLEKCIWIHAVSLGETIAAIPLIKALKTQYPTIPILVTNMTPTGKARAQAVFNDHIYQAYIPYDLPDANSRFLKNFNPLIAIIMETELWPNLFAACQHYHIPIVVTNARLSEKSARGYHHIASLTQAMLRAIHMLAAQAKADADRFIALGLPKENITVVGNIKFDLELPKDLDLKSKALREQLGQDRFIWIAASTHPTEEEIILNAHRLICAQKPSALLILVPRHPERFDSVATLAEQQGFHVIRRSRNEPCTAQTNVYLGDTMGELLSMYAASDVAFVAGSFASVGGHNMLEPAALHKPIITGPQLFNFSEISQLLLDAKGMIKVHNAEELAQCVLKFFSDDVYRRQTGDNAYRVVEANRGALARQLTIINDTLSHLR